MPRLSLRAFVGLILAAFICQAPAAAQIISGVPAPVILARADPYANALFALDFTGVRTSGQPYYRAFGVRAQAFTGLPNLTVTNSTGGFGACGNILTKFPANTPRITCQGLLHENAATNLVPTSTPTNAAWSLSKAGTGVQPVLTDSYALGPDGTMTAARVQLDKGAGNTSSDFSQAFSGNTASLTGTYTSCLWIRTNDGTTKAISLRDGFGVTGITVNGTFARYCITDAYVTTAAAIGVRLRGGAENTAQTADLVIWNGQQELGAFGTSDIISTGSGATRSADVVQFSGLSLAAPYCEVGWWSPPVPGAVIQRVAQLSDGTRTLDLATDTSSPASVQVQGSGITSGPVGAVTYANGSTVKGALSLIGTTVTATSGGSTPTTMAGNSTLVTATQLFVGDVSGGGRSINGYAKMLAIYPFGCGSAQLQGYTQ